MSKTVRVYIVVAVLAAVGLYVGVQVLESPLIGLLIAGVAVIGGLYLLNRETSDSDGFFTTPESHRSESHDDVDEDEDDAPPPLRPRRGTATAEPLATWEGEGLTPWTPPEAADDDVVVVEEDDIELDALDLAELDHIDEFIESETENDTVDEFSDLDLDELLDAEPDEVVEDRFDAFDPDAFSKDPVGDTRTEEPHLDEPVDLFDELQQLEDVHTDEDIMKASEVTSLEHTGAAAGGADNSELAKLLAKVQSRLAAYE